MNISILTNDTVEDYVYSLWRQDSAFLRQLRQKSVEGLVPIISKDTERLLYTLCKIHNPKKILEIGTAIGYSAICLAYAAPQAEIITLEARERSFHKASNNLETAGVSGRVTVILGKAEELILQIEDVYDMIFIDAAKGQYMTFFDLSKKNMKPGTLIISDNVLYKGMPADDSFIHQRRDKTIARRMNQYLEFLTMSPHLETCLLPIGDGVAVSYCKTQLPSNKNEITY